MAWSTPKLFVSEHTAHTVRLSFPFNRNINAALKELGARWTPEVKSWTLGESMVPMLKEEIAESFGLELVDNTERKPLTAEAQKMLQASLETLSPKLFPFQREALARTLGRQCALFAFSTGLGKTLTAITALRLRHLRSAIIICPAIVRLTWQEELEKWWPEHPLVTVISPRRMQKVKEGKAELPPLAHGGIYITSYEMLEHIPTEDEDYHPEAIVLDEVHMLANARSKRSQQVAALCESLPSAFKLGLTATLIPNRLENLYHPMHCLAPGSWGTWWRFVHRYCHVTEGQYGLEIGEPLEERLDELQARLSMYAVQVTKDEVAHLLPAYTMQTYTIEQPEERTNLGAKLARLAEQKTEDLTSEDLQMFLDVTANLKIDAALSHVGEVVSEGADRVCVAVFRKITGAKLLAKLHERFGAQGIHCALVTGDMSQEERKEAIAQAKAQPRSIVVTTYHSVGIGINDLVDFNHIILAELYWQPGVMLQFLGRFQRLSSTRPVWLRCLVVENTVDDAAARVLREKLGTINTVLESSKADRDFDRVLDTSHTDEELLARLRDICGDFDALDIREELVL